MKNRKGFPDSYDLTKLLNFLADVKSGKDRVEAPVYSHLVYDVLPDQTLVIERPDIVIVEGLNVLQPAKLPRTARPDPLRLRLLRFLDLYRRGRGRGRELVRGALLAA